MGVLGRQRVGILRKQRPKGFDSTRESGANAMLNGGGFFLQRCGSGWFFAKVWLAPFWSSNAPIAVNYSICSSWNVSNATNYTVCRSWNASKCCKLQHVLVLERSDSKCYKLHHLLVFAHRKCCKLHHVLVLECFKCCKLQHLLVLERLKFKLQHLLVLEHVKRCKL